MTQPKHRVVRPYFFSYSQHTLIARLQQASKRRSYCRRMTITAKRGRTLDEGADLQAHAGTEQRATSVSTQAKQAQQGSSRVQAKGDDGEAGAEALVDQELRKLERKIEAQSRQHTVLPGEDDEDLEERGFRRQDLGPIKDLDPSHAAKRRAAWRAEDRRRNAVMDVSVIPSEVAAAEEDYDEPEQMFLTDNIPVEPFNLRREREEGYFDQEGNYIEYRMDPGKRDAWLELLDMDPNQQVKGELADRLMQQAASMARANAARKAAQGTGGASSSKAATASGMDVDQDQDQDQDDDEDDQGLEGFPSEEPEQVWSQEDLLAFKSRMSALLLPGETPLAGLRRLAEPTSAPGQKPQPSTAERQRALKQRHAQEAQAPENTKTGGASEAQIHGSTGGTVSSAGQNVSRAVASGERDCLLHQESQPAGPINPRDSNHQAARSNKKEMREQGSGRAEVLTETVTGQGDGVTGSTGRAGASGSPAQGPRHSNGARHANPEFDKLTEYADLLLGAGDFSVYTKTREQLLAEVARATAKPSGRISAGHIQSASATAASTSDQLVASAGVTGSEPGAMETDMTDVSGRAEKLAASLLGSAMKDVLAGEVVHSHEAHDVAVAAAVEASHSGEVAQQAGLPVRAGDTSEQQGDVDMFDAEDAQPTVALAAAMSQPQSVATPTVLSKDMASQSTAGTGTAAGTVAGTVAGSSLASFRPATQVAATPTHQAEEASEMTAAGTGGQAAGAVMASGAMMASGADTLTVSAEGASSLIAPAAGAGSSTANAGSSSIAVGSSGANTSSSAGGSSSISGQQGISMMDVLGGFEADQDSGLFYNSSMGLWYDPQRKLFMDANTGSWYRITDGQQYEAVPEAGQGLPVLQAKPAPQPLPA